MKKSTIARAKKFPISNRLAYRAAINSASPGQWVARRYQEANLIYSETYYRFWKTRRAMV